jgi:hypothetical protein
MSLSSEQDAPLDRGKDLGHALRREEIMTSASDRMTVVVDETKLVTCLGGNRPLSAEIVSFGWQIFVLDRLMAIGGFQLRWIGRLGDDAARDVIAASVLWGCDLCGREWGAALGCDRLKEIDHGSGFQVRLHRPDFGDYAN